MDSTVRPESFQPARGCGCTAGRSAENMPATPSGATARAGLSDSACLRWGWVPPGEVRSSACRLAVEQLRSEWTPQQGWGRPPRAATSAPPGISTPHVVRVGRYSRCHGYCHERCQTVSMDTSDDHTYSEAPDQQGLSGGSTAVFTMREAANVAGISVSTLRRRRADLIAGGAVIESSGWQVPITALIAAGLIPGEGEPPARPETGRSERTRPDPSRESGIRHFEEQVRELEQQVAEWRRRAEIAEARAEERGRSLEILRTANETERLALRMLTGGAPLQAGESAAAEHSAETQFRSTTREGAEPAEKRKRGFFRGLFAN